MERRRVSGSPRNARLGRCARFVQECTARFASPKAWRRLRAAASLVAACHHQGVALHGILTLQRHCLIMQEQTHETFFATVRVRRPCVIRSGQPRSLRTRE